MNRGFTLVEVMLVVAIIGLLAAIGIPSIIGAHTNAMVRVMQRNVAEVNKAKGVLTLLWWAQWVRQQQPQLQKELKG